MRDAFAALTRRYPADEGRALAALLPSVGASALRREIEQSLGLVPGSIATECSVAVLAAGFFGAERIGDRWHIEGMLGLRPGALG